MPAKPVTYHHHAPMSPADEKRAVASVKFIRNADARAAALRFARKFVRYLNGVGYSPGVPKDGPVSADDVARIRATLRGKTTKSAAAKPTTRKPTAKRTRATK